MGVGVGVGVGRIEGREGSGDALSSERVGFSEDRVLSGLEEEERMLSCPEGELLPPISVVVFLEQAAKIERQVSVARISAGILIVDLFFIIVTLLLEA